MSEFIDSPDDAEHVNLLDCLHSERVPSKHMPGETVLISTILCPGCRTNLGKARHLEITTCPGCELKVVPNGTDIVVWREKAVDNADRAPGPVMTGLPTRAYAEPPDEGRG